VNEGVASAAPASGSLGALGGSLLALILVVALILALGWLLRRLPGNTLRGHPQLRVVAQLSLGVRERLVVVAVGDQQHLIGVSSERISLLSTLETPLGDPPPSDFAKLLSRQRGGSQ
jgi:flagellar protein FliO/FliZ